MTQASFWQQIFGEAEPLGTFWLRIKHTPDGPIARLPSGRTVIFPFEPQPPIDSLCNVILRKTKLGELLGQWTGEKAD